MAIGCSHGHLIHRGISEQVLQFAKSFKPHTRFHLGDVVDTAAFRGGASGTKDEAEPIAPDRNSAVEFLKAYVPTHVAWGNHDWRLWEMAHSPKAIVAHCASELRDQLIAAVGGAQTVPYHFRQGWFELGGYYWGHGFWFNEQAVRDHAEFLGGPLVMAHLHVPQQVQGRTRKWTESFCTGLLGDPDLMTYAHRRRATARWGHGVVFGEYTEREARLWLAKSAPGQPLQFPTGM